jgi:hypothetical protein
MSGSELAQLFLIANQLISWNAMRSSMTMMVALAMVVFQMNRIRMKNNWMTMKNRCLHPSNNHLEHVQLFDLRKVSE